MKTNRLLNLLVFLLSVKLTIADSIINQMDAVIAQESGNCSLINSIPSVDQCSFVVSQCGDEISGYINYLSMYYCRFGFLGSFSILPLVVCLVFLFVWLGLTASEYLCPNLYTMSKAMNLSDNLAGLTLLALGNASPDVLGTFQAMSLGYDSLAISELMGAALFITTVVIGSMALIRPFSVPRDSFIRDVSFFLSVSLLLLASLVDSKLTFTNCLTLVVVYVIYVFYVVIEHSYKKQTIKMRLREQRARGHHSVSDHTNEQVDAIYLDNFSSLPTIDEIALGRSPDNTNDTPGTNADNYPKTNAYDLNLLIRELDFHGNSHGRIRLENERPLTHPIAVPHSTDLNKLPHSSPPQFNEYREDEENVGELPALEVQNDQLTIGDEETLSNYSYESMRINVFKIFNDKMNMFNVPDFLELGIFNQIYFIISFLALLILNLTNPVVEHSLISNLKYKLRAPLSLTPTSQEEASDSVEEEEESMKVSLQLFFGLNFVIYMIFGDLKFYFLISLPLGLVLTSAIAYSIRSLYHYNLSTILYMNYFISFVGFLVSISWIAIFATEIIGILKSISTIYNLSHEILGVTVFALGNCIGDFISNVTVARMGVPVMAVGACFGGPLLAISSIGASGLIIIQNQNLINGFNVEFSRTNSITCITLIANIIFLLISVPKNNWMLDRKIGTILICNWLIATTLSIISEFN